MKKIILLVSCLGLSALANAQSPAFEWAKNIGGTSQDESNSNAIDAAGNVYTSGTFTATVDFDPGAGTFNLTSAGDLDIFISKLDMNGNFVWAKHMGGTYLDACYSIAIDGNGNVYTTGYFKGTADFDPGPGIYNLTAPGSYDNIFISKLDASGNFIWAKQMGGASLTSTSSIAVDINGNIYTTGHLIGIADLDPNSGIYNLTSVGNFDIFVSKLDSTGSFRWAKRMGGTENDQGSSIALDGAGNIYTAGFFSDTADFDPNAGIFNLSSKGGTDIFVSKLDTAGNFVWVEQMGGTAYDYGYSLYVDANANVYVTGIFFGTADFDPTNGIYNLTSSGNWDIFISKFDSSGNFVWAKQLGGTDHDLSNSIAVDASGNVYTTGYFKGTADFDPGVTTYNVVSAGNYDIFISKLSPSGNFLWVKQLGGSSYEYGYSIIVDGSDNVYSTGVFGGTMDFNPDAGIFNLTSVGGSDIFIHKMSQCSPPSAMITPDGATTFCNGGSLTLSANNNLTFHYQWKKNGANISGATASTYSVTSTGSYTVVITNPCGSSTSGAVNVAVNSLPSATITPAGPTTFCSGGNVVLNAPVATNRTYQWKKAANLISGATLSSYTATTGGNYKVIVTNTVTGCSKTTSNATVVTVNALPTATVTPQGPTTFCAGGSVVLAANTGTGLTYKWKKAAAYISGATLSNYTATTGGNYKVEVTNSNGCSKTSANITVSVPCKSDGSESESGFDFAVYPNPNSGEFTIKFSNKTTLSIQIELTDAIGKVVKKIETDNETVLIKETNLAMGIYYLAARSRDNAVIKKIIVIQ